jgi:hypothetical protein
MARETVWIRRDPVGAHTRLPSRDQFRARHARSALVSGAIAVGALTVLVVLRALPRWEGLWNPLLAIAFCFGIAGVAAGAIAIRARSLRMQAMAAVVVSFIAVVGAVFVDELVHLAGG